MFSPISPRNFLPLSLSHHEAGLPDWPSLNINDYVRMYCAHAKVLDRTTQPIFSTKKSFWAYFNSQRPGSPTTVQAVKTSLLTGVTLI